MTFLLLSNTCPHLHLVLRTYLQYKYIPTLSIYPHSYPSSHSYFLFSSPFFFAVVSMEYLSNPKFKIFTTLSGITLPSPSLFFLYFSFIFPFSFLFFLFLSPFFLFFFSMLCYVHYNMSLCHDAKKKTKETKRKEGYLFICLFGISFAFLLSFLVLVFVFEAE